MKEIQWEGIKQYMLTKPWIWGDLSNLDLEEAKALFKTKSYATRVKHLKLRWGLLATNHVRMIQQRVKPEENRCPLCGSSPDTNNHFLVGCEHSAMIRIRKLWATNVERILRNHAAAPATWKCRRDGLCTSEWIAANRAGGSCGKLDSPAASGRPQISHTRREPRRSLGHKRLRNAAGARRCEYWTSRFSAPAILLQAIKLPLIRGRAYSTQL